MERAAPPIRQRWPRLTPEMSSQSFLPPGHHPLETCAKFGKMNPVDFHLERLDTFLLWNRERDSNVATSGNTDLMNLWHGNFRVRWG